MDGRPTRGQPDDGIEELEALLEEVRQVTKRAEVIAMNFAHRQADLEYRIALVIEKRNERLK